MKLTINKITIDNFKNIEHLEQKFGYFVKVMGANETGKTTFADAISWCLTGKNSLGEANPNIVPIEKQETSPTVTLEVLLDKKPATISRCYQAKLNRDKEYSGEHQTVCYINGIKQSIKDFETWVDNNICNREIFRLLFDVKYFTENITTNGKEKVWEAQRRLLFSICGIKSDSELAKKRKKFEPLISELSRYTNINQYLIYLKNLLKDNMRDIASCNKHIKLYDEEKEQIHIDKSVEEIEKEINNLTDEAEKRLRDWHIRQEQYQKGVAKANEQIAKLNSQSAEYAAEIKLALSQYKETEQKLNNMLEVCPTCGAALDPTKVQKQKNQLKICMEQQKEAYSEALKQKNKIEAQIVEIKKDMAIWSKPEMPIERQEYMDKLKELNKQLASSSEINKYEKWIVEAEEQRSNLYDTRAYLQQQIDLCQEFITYKCEQATKTINAMFNGVTFELFKQNKTNDEIKDCCDIFWQGVPYESLSYSTKFIVSLYIVLAFQKHYDVKLPIVVDNAESFDYIPSVGVQTIQLIKQAELCPQCQRPTDRKQADGLWHCICGNKFKKTLKITASNPNLIS